MLEGFFEVVARFVFYTVFYRMGWVLLKTVTFGRYPPSPPTRHNKALVALFPVATVFVGLTLAFS